MQVLPAVLKINNQNESINASRMDSIRVKERKASDNVIDANGLRNWQPHRSNNEVPKGVIRRREWRGNYHRVDLDEKSKDRKEN